MIIVISAIAGLIVLCIVLFWVLTHLQDKHLRTRFPSTGHLTHVAGGTIHWTKSGSGPNVLLIHGLAGNIHNFSALEKELAKQYTVYAIDRPGSGHSSRNRGTDASFTYQAAMILEWMDKQSIDSAIVVGHSMGGAIALNLAIQQPSRVVALGLICPLTAPLKIKPTLSTKLFLSSPLLRRAFAKTLLSVVGRKLSRRQLPVLFYPEPIAPGFATHYGGALTLHSDAFLAATQDLAGAQRSLYQQIKRYGEIQCPIGVIYGEGDRILSPKLHTQIIEQSIPHAKIELLAQRGHMIPITEPERVAQFIIDIASST